MAVRIRAALPEDAPFLAWVVLAASRSHLARGAWDLWVDGPDERVLGFLQRLATQPQPSFCRWQGFLVAEVDGTPAAGLSGYAARDPGMLDPDPAIAAASRAVLGWGDGELDAAVARLAPFLTCVVAPAPDAWSVEWVATRPAFRRRGLVRELLDAVVEVGRRRGLEKSQIFVFVDNDAARCAYERAGYRIVEERRHPEFARVLGTPGIARMTRAL